MLVGMQSAPPLTFTRVTNVCVVQVPVEGGGGGMDVYCVVIAIRVKSRRESPAIYTGHLQLHLP